ncbi:MAG: ABC transporter ATP-binding protein [Finegoldia sp.]|nr:ABC transporter ATP-binding protein [Finegoldia sp.]
MSKISLKKVCKIYDNSSDYAVKDFNLDIEEKEFIVFVGPSGCGKSTTLRMIAGLEDISEGDLYIDQKRMNDVAAKDRKIAMVFQNYALYPQLNVYDNIGFGLKIRGVDKKERDKRIREVAQMLNLTDFLKRKPAELSGGQKQRVALGRAIVKEADIFLMDEPLSNLDAKLRVRMREELVELQRKLGSTVIYVTHDQTEAMTMATRIVCLNNGEIQQVGTPEELYFNPTNMFVAGFLGSPPMNFIGGRIEGGKFLDKDKNYICDIGPISNRQVVLGIRPEAIKLSDNTNSLKLRVNLLELLGSDYHIHGKVYNNKITIKTEVNPFIKEKEDLYISFAPEKILLFDPETGERILGEA